MKNYLFLRFLMLAVLLACAAGATAQSAPASSAGYWNIETNLTTRDYTIVRFYNAQNQLVYEETLPNLCLNMSSTRPLCRRTMGQLNLALQRVISDPGLAASNPALLAQEFSTDRRVQRVYAVR